MATLGLTMPGLAKRLRRRRVPVLMQMSATECGTACLAMILSGLGRKTSVGFYEYKR